MMKSLHKKIFHIASRSDFDKVAMNIFRFQSKQNPVYADYLRYLGINPAGVKSIRDIPFLPVETFKHNRIISGGGEAETIFRSSGTTGSERSSHHLVDNKLYRKSILEGFRHFYGDPSKYHILGLLPSYLERDDSSLIYMVDFLMLESGSKEGGFFLSDYDTLVDRLLKLKQGKRKILLVGVTFALLHLATEYSPDLSGVIVMETGGMKGMETEMTRGELHSRLTRSLNLEKIHSEYGMTELLSQAYSDGEGIFSAPPWMKIVIRDPLDPFSMVPVGRGGAINIIDLANLYSCSFIETSDLGSLHDDGRFIISGRFDSSDIRGCNLLTE